MANLGQSSSDFKGGSSALRILYAGHQNTVSATLTTDAFTQTNPPVVTAANARSQQLSATPKYGVLSGSVCFTRPDAGNGYVGGALAAADLPDPTAGEGALRALGLFINDAQGHAFENAPAAASGQGPYVSSQGTMACALFETQNLTSGADLTYMVGDLLYASSNGYLTNLVADALEPQHTGAPAATVLGVVKVAPDTALDEIIFDLRV